jgi:hypothetical protein
VVKDHEAGRQPGVTAGLVNFVAVLIIRGLRPLRGILIGYENIHLIADQRRIDDPTELD